MDPITILETFGLPVAMVIALGFYIKKKDKEAEKQNEWIQNDLSKDIHRKFNMIHDVVDKDLRMILIKLIDNAKKNEIRMASIERSHKAVIEVIARLSGNGLKHKLMRMIRKDEEEF
ncbi:MAG: hypothetical protein Unbinned5336contig1001_29 [Prokaryotic dsDNA virus sp.]|nr:MAG: hypothetical protein Unbinned5336contig1001_29 [Prokaryotic dsDNA virus sp.]|tara:strand:- start:88 stop:438 length:351 start_codon:yes stop_codon:yes gene_type:complete